MIHLKRYDAFLISEQSKVISRIAKAIKPGIDDAVKAVKPGIDDAIKAGKSLVGLIPKIKSKKDFIEWANSKTTPEGDRIVKIIFEDGKVVATIGNPITDRHLRNVIKEEIEVSNPKSLLNYIENYNKSFKEGEQILFIEKIPNLTITHNCRASRINQGELFRVSSSGSGSSMCIFKEVKNGKVYYYFQRSPWEDKFLAGKATNILLNKIPKGGLLAEPHSLSLDSFYFYLRRTKDKRFSPMVDGYVELNAQAIHKSKLPQYKKIIRYANEHLMFSFGELSFKTEKTATKLKNLIDEEITKIGLGEEFFSRVKRNDKDDWTLELPRIVLRKL